MPSSSSRPQEAERPLRPLNFHKWPLGPSSPTIDVDAPPPIMKWRLLLDYIGLHWIALDLEFRRLEHNLTSPSGGEWGAGRGAQGGWKYSHFFPFILITSGLVDGSSTAYSSSTVVVDRVCTSNTFDSLLMSASGDLPSRFPYRSFRNYYTPHRTCR